jgi:hypothetical protein
MMMQYPSWRSLNGRCWPHSAGPPFCPAAAGTGSFRSARRVQLHRGLRLASVLLLHVALFRVRPPPIGTWPLMCSRAMASLPMSSGRTSKLDSFSLSRPNWWGLSLDEPLSPRWACWNWGLVIYLYVRCQLRVFIWILLRAAHLP